MPVSARRVTERVIDRIRQSEYRLTVFYPKATTKPTSTGQPIALPSSPLVRPPNPQPETGIEAERVLPEVTMQCLFTNATMLSEFRQRRVEAEVAGWRRDTAALARVQASDAERSEGGTVFDGCDFVEVDGRRFRVQNVVRQAASTAKLGTYYVLLTGASEA
jgi:hypothetical protein